MAEFKEPGTLGSTPGTTGTATHSTETNSTITGGIVGRVREQATAQLSSQKDKATDGLGSVAQAVRETTKHLRDNQHDTVARYAEQTADRLERFSQRLKDKDVGELLNDAQQLARRQPALFIGGAFALGLLGARFLKSSAPEGRTTYGHTGSSGYGGGDYGGSGYGDAGSRYGDAGSRDTGYGSSGAGNTAVSVGLTGSGMGSGGTGASTAGPSSPTSESTKGQGTSTSGRGENAYGNRVPSSSRKASGTPSQRTDYPPTEGL